MGRGASPAAPPSCTCMPTAARTPSATAGCARRPTGWPMCCARTASAAATASRSCCRRRRKSPSRISRSTSSAPWRCRSRFCSAPDASLYRLQNSGAKALITNAQGLAKLDEIRDELPELTCVLSLDGAGDGAAASPDMLARASSDFTPVDTSADDPALMIYTSGTTGQPKGALHAHRVLLGHLPGVEMPHDSSRSRATGSGRRPTGPGPAACSTCCCRACITACRWWRGAFDKFDPEEAFALMAKAGVRNAFIPPTALRMLRAGAEPARPLRFQACARIGSGGERSASKPTNGASGVRPHDQRILRPDRMQPGARLLRGARRARSPAPSARPVPGHTVAVIDARRQRSASRARSGRSR